MWKRFVLWLKRLFSSDDSPDSETTAEEMTSTVEKLDVVSCEVVSIAFEEEDEKEENSHQPTTLKTSRLGSESSNARRIESGD
jgi:hypothetical protein